MERSLDDVMCDEVKLTGDTISSFTGIFTKSRAAFR